MKTLAFQRTDDGELFVLDPTTGDYCMEAMEREFPGSRRMHWSESTLANTTGFKPIYDEALLTDLLKEKYK